MAKHNLMPLIAAATLTIVCSVATAAAAPSMTQQHDSYVQKNMPAEGSATATSATPHWQPLQRTAQQKHVYAYASATAQPATKRRSYSGVGRAGGLAAMLNSLTNLSGLGHISNGYGAVAPTHTEASPVTAAKQQIPIYEEQQEDATVAAVTGNDYSSSGAGEQQQPPIYNYAGFLPAEQAAWTPVAAQHVDEEAQQLAGPEQRYGYDKISLGNLMQHYGHYDEEQLHQQLQQHADELEQQHQQPHNVQQAAYYGTQAASGSAEEQRSTNYLNEGDAHAPSQQSHHTEIINYLPYPVVKQQHVPFERTVKIPISHAVILPVRKPVPIHIPVPKQVTVEVEQELKIPVERVVPYPIEKHVPVPVEKRVPYQVIKYMPIKVPKPFPVKVPVFKTVLHKVKGWW